jgi:hypothetical protein
MSARFLTDEHVPGPFVRVLRSTGHDVLRAKDECPPGTDDGFLLSFGAETGRIVITCDKRFTVVDGQRVADHAGVVYADQTTLQRDPEDAVRGVDRIVSTVPSTERTAAEFYLTDWL